MDDALRWLVRAGSHLVGWRIEAYGRRTLPLGIGGRPAGGCLVAVAPHRAWIDPFLLIAAWPSDAARLVWFGDGPTMVRSWWRRWLFPRLGMIPITPGSGGPRVYAELAATVLATGAALVVFPEKGPPSPPEATRRVAPGFAYLARRAGAPVIPVVLGGTHRIVRGSPFTVDVLAPLAAAPGAPAAIDPDALFSPVGRSAAAALVAEYQAAIDAVLPARTARADARRPAHDRWRWLATLFH